MAHNTSNKLFAGILALSAGFVLAACDPISAVPANYNENIVTGLKEEDEDNVIGKIYENIASDRNSKIVSDLLDEIAYKKFGYYHELVNAYGDEDATKAFIESHAEVFKKDADDVERFNTFVEDIKERISEALYNDVTGGTYNDNDGRFDETKFIKARQYEFYDIKETTDSQTNSFYITKEFDKYDVFNGTKSLKGVYDVVAERNEWEAKSKEEKEANPFKMRGYIEEKIFPQVIKDKLVEEYVYNNNYSALGRAYARQVQYIKVSYEDLTIPQNLLANYADKYIYNQAQLMTDNLNFEIIANSLKGFTTFGDFRGTDGGIMPITSGDEYDLLEKTLTSSAEKITVPDSDDYKLDGDVLVGAGEYFKETEVGKLLDSYQKALKAVEQGRFPTVENKEELDKFTGNDKSMQYNLREKLVSIVKEDITTEGWFIKNGGLSDLPSALRDRLFNINVANVLDNENKLKLEDGTEGKEYGCYEKGENGENLSRLPFLRNIHGRKLVIPAESARFSKDKYNFIYHDKSAKAFYMVQVLEAPSTPKLNKDQANSYAQMDKEDTFKTEKIARQIAKVLGTKDSYIKDAYTEYLNAYTFTFYETSFYDYFKNEYPDLDIFDED